MTGFAIKTTETAPVESRDLLGAVEEGVGFVPNIYGVFAGVPSALKGLASLNEAFGESSFSPAEREIIALTTSVYNQCPYCVAGHSVFALRNGVDAETVSLIRAGSVSDDPQFQVLGQITHHILEKNGAIGAAEMRRFLNAGFRATQILELLLGIAGKTMTNFAAKIARVPLDAEFADHAWAPVDAPNAA